MILTELETLQKVNQMDIVPTPSYVDLNLGPKWSKETVHESESSDLSKECKNLIDDKEELKHNKNIQKNFLDKMMNKKQTNTGQ